MPCAWAKLASAGASGNGNVYVSGDKADAGVSWRGEDLRVFGVAREVCNNCVLTAAAANY